MSECSILSQHRPPPCLFLRQFLLLSHYSKRGLIYIDKTNYLSNYSQLGNPVRTG